MIMKPEDIDCRTLTKAQLQLYKIFFDSYIQGITHAVEIMRASFDMLLDKSLETYDKKIKEIDELLGEG